MIYKTKGTCSTSIDVELKDGVIEAGRSNQPSQGDPLRFQAYLLS